MGNIAERMQCAGPGSAPNFKLIPFDMLIFVFHIARTKIAPLSRLKNDPKTITDLGGISVARGL